MISSLYLNEHLCEGCVLKHAQLMNINIQQECILVGCIPAFLWAPPRQGSHFFYPIKFPDFSLTFPWFFLSFHQDILVKNLYLFFLNVALVTLLHANIVISWQFLRFNSLKKHFPQIYRCKRFENGWEKKFPDLKFFSLILAVKNPLFFPDFPDWKKSSKFSLNSLIGGNPARWTEFLTHACENITFPQLPLRT